MDAPDDVVAADAADVVDFGIDADAGADAAEM